MMVLTTLSKKSKLFLSLLLLINKSDMQHMDKNQGPVVQS